MGDSKKASELLLEVSNSSLGQSLSLRRGLNSTGNGSRSEAGSRSLSARKAGGILRKPNRDGVQSSDARKNDNAGSRSPDSKRVSFDVSNSIRNDSKAGIRTKNEDIDTTGISNDTPQDKLRPPFEPPLLKYSHEELGLTLQVDLAANYAKNVAVYFLLIFGNQYLTGNLLLVWQLQIVYSLWMFFSLLRIKSSSVGFVFQELFYKVYLMCLVYYYYNSADRREFAVMVVYFLGLSFAVFFVFFELVFVFVIRPLRVIIGRPVPE